MEFGIGANFFKKNVCTVNFDRHRTGTFDVSTSKRLQKKKEKKSKSEGVFDVFLGNSNWEKKFVDFFMPLLELIENTCLDKSGNETGPHP